MQSIPSSPARLRVVPLLAVALAALTLGVVPAVSHPAAGSSVTHVADSEWGD
ncbi:MAG TPA: hypothetical protein VKV34_12540 [Thermoleophilia bacterium]|jgi:hypothetical protein|nr:hypothetical protein [Thermoleophilia bacterium]